MIGFNRGLYTTTCNIMIRRTLFGSSDCICSTTTSKTAKEEKLIKTIRVLLRSPRKTVPRKEKPEEPRSSDFLLLSAMAYDRYVSICEPLQYASTMGTSRVAAFLALAWFVPACHVLVATVISAEQRMCHFLLAGIFCNNSIQKLFCATPRFLTVWGLLVLTNITLIPVVFIVFTYVKIFAVAYRSCGEVRKKAAETCLPHLMVLISFSCLCGFDVIVARLESDLSKTVRLIMSLQIVVYNPLFNPILYGVKMKEIWKHIMRLLQLCGKCDVKVHALKS
ncbi:olfactory receptor 52E2-like isoform X2 [Syngnathoides biaculeatus]|nr:olfactory receptor 52E2-like isoform X2 [Syngnathoides biaculeatus]XP_061698651.1 olfactory receptor 52E2-like isoform X2 [Syngnathoides biaculeatus]XP_061698652.1 olfactory receptor 52E2-like isoform X2 [Syngnathoides biaculeatus]